MSNIGADGEEAGRRGQEEAAHTLPPPLGEPVRRTVVLGDHPVGVRGRARALHVDGAPGGLVRDPPADPPQPPTEVHVLHVHEVALVPSPHRVEGAAPQVQERPRDPVDVASPIPHRVELAVATGEPVPGEQAAEHGVPDGVGGGRVGAGGGVLRAVGVEQRRPHRGQVGLGVEAPQHRGRSAGGDVEVGVGDGDDRRGRRRDPPVGGGCVADVLARVDDRDPRGARPAGRRPSRRSTRCRRRRPRAPPHSCRSGSTGRTPAAAAPTRSSRPRPPSGPSQSVKRYLTRVQSATKPSRQVIFLPSSNSRPVYEIGTS